MTDNPQILYLKNKKSNRFQNDWTEKIEQLEVRVKELEEKVKALEKNWTEAFGDGEPSPDIVSYDGGDFYK
jgi:hypothetical protein